MRKGTGVRFEFDLFDNTKNNSDGLGEYSIV
jgi:hypothetical protein